MSSNLPPDASLDIESLDELFELLEFELVALIELFEINSKEQLQKIEQLSAQNLLDDVRLEAHSLKGSCRNIGAIKMALLLEYLESVVQDEMAGVKAEVEKANLPTLLKELNVSCGDTVSALHQYIQSK